MGSAFAWVFGKLRRRYVLCHIMLRNLCLGRFPFPQHSQSIFIEAMPTPSKQRPTPLCVSERAGEGVSERARTQVSKSSPGYSQNYLHHDPCVFQRINCCCYLLQVLSWSKACVSVLMTNPWSATTFAKEGGLVMKLSNATLTNAQPGENAYLPRTTAIDQFG